MAHTQSAGRPRQPASRPKLAASCTSTHDLTATEHQLLRLMQQVGFGRLESLRVYGGQPDFGELRIIRDIKLGAGADGPPRPDGDFVLKQEAREFFTVLRGLDAAVIRKIEIRHGLPVHLQVQESSEATGGGR